MRWPSQLGYYVRRVATVRSDTGEVRYLVLAECAAPYLLARVRWPDVAQAITARLAPTGSTTRACSICLTTRTQ